MVEVLTYVMGISIGSIGLNIPLLSKYLMNCKRCSCSYVGENRNRCSQIARTSKNK